MALPKRSWKLVAGVLAAVVLLPTLAVAGMILYYRWTGTPVIDEWHCRKGEAPYLDADGGSACAKVGSTIPEGASWDPLGNRPYLCHHRRGWIEIEQEAEPGVTGDCVRHADQIPEGWQRAPQ